MRDNHRTEAIVWLGFRHDDHVRARDLLKAAQDEGVLDELGFLALQGRFADIFYPATSTLMRAARYLYFVAAMYRQLEREGFTSSQVAQAARRRQDELRDVLARNEKIGVIGRDAGLQIKQLPSSIYWSSLRQLGLFLANLSEAGYHGKFDELRAQARGYTDDDKTRQSADCVQFWDLDIPKPRFLNEEGAFRSSASFRLSRPEATDLHERFTTRFPDSLLVHLLRAESSDIPTPWAAPRPSAELARYLRHAEALSAFARGTTLQYYLLVTKARNDGGMGAADESVPLCFGHWWHEARRILLDWNLDEFARLPGVGDALRVGTRGDISFFESWLKRVRETSTSEALLADREAQDTVRRREIEIKPTKARLKNRKYLENWSLPELGSGAYQLLYRHQIGIRFVREILLGRGGEV